MRNYISRTLKAKKFTVISCNEDCENCEHRHVCKDLLPFEKFLYSKTNIRKK